MPRYTFFNATGMTLLLTQQDIVNTLSHVTLPPNGRLPFHWLRADLPRRLCLRLDRPGWQWSGPFSISEVGDFHVKFSSAAFDKRPQV